MHKTYSVPVLMEPTIVSMCMCMHVFVGNILNKELHKDIFTNCDTCHRGKILGDINYWEWGEFRLGILEKLFRKRHLR